ncbi:dihydrofolate reductase family protein [Ereboglobus luteus]|nr:dihydrofolate reductase family protein [Ereboglobus luteus]
MSLRVILIAAQSLDGRITFHDVKGATFASAADRQYFREVLRGFDCSVMGGETFRVSEKAIRGRKDDGRLQIIMTRRSGATDPWGSVSGVLEFSRESPEKIIAGLKARGKKRCALLGGGQIYGAFLAAGVVDEVWLTVEPRIFGAGVPLTTQAVDVKLALLDCERLSSDTLLLKYKVT